jgi:hypothetical protein
MTASVPRSRVPSAGIMTEETTVQSQFASIFLVAQAYERELRADAVRTRSVPCRDVPGLAILRHWLGDRPVRRGTMPEGAKLPTGTVPGHGPSAA